VCGIATQEAFEDDDIVDSKELQNKTIIKAVYSNRILVGPLINVPNSEINLGKAIQRILMQVQLFTLLTSCERRQLS
jgi:hypothetical protein